MLKNFIFFLSIEVPNMLSKLPKFVAELLKPKTWPFSDKLKCYNNLALVLHKYIATVRLDHAVIYL